MVSFGGGPRQDRATFNPPRIPHGLTRIPTIHRDTRAWQLQVWVSFGTAVFLCATGLAWLPGEELDRAFMVMGYVFCLSAVFVLAKFVRDSQSGTGDTPMWRLVVWVVLP